ncbi:MAG: ABC transporter ATP-binding protein [Clostridia bacterium]|nr:ABC transporter ATP-binding protein [Clostridia bacterium]
MKRFFYYFKGYVAETILSPLFKMLEAISELCVPLVVAKIIDVGVANGDRAYIIKYSLLLVLLGVAGLVVALFAQYFASKSATGYASKVRLSLMEKTHKLSFKQLDEQGASKLVNVMTEDVMQVQTGVNLTLRLLLRSPFIVFGAVLFSFLFADAKASLIYTVLIPLLLFIVYFIMTQGIKKFKKARNTADQMLLATRENLYGVREVRAFSLEGQEEQKFNAINENLKTDNTKASNFLSFLNPLTYSLVNIGIIILIYSGAIRVNAGAISTGVVVALYNYMSQILVELIKFVNLTISVSKMFASLERINKVLDLPEDKQEFKSVENQKVPYIFINGLNFTYTNKGKNVLDNLSLSLEKGQTLGIIGGTGSGKSTLCSLFYRGYDSYEGDFYINGKSLKDYTDTEIRQLLAVVPQKAVLFDGTLRENLTWGKKDATDKELLHAVDMSAASEVLNKCGGLDGVIEESGKNLSGGQRQRLTIARALVKDDAEIIIFDDSFSALDFATEAKLLKNLNSYSCTKIIVSQRVSSLRCADKILVLEKGKIDAFGTMEEVLSSSEIFREIYNSQVKEEV